MRYLKCLCAVLALALCVMPFGGALAAEMDGTGKEARGTLTLDWHGLPMLDDQTNAAIAALLDTLTFSGRAASTDDSLYGDYAVTLEGRDAYSGQYYCTADGMYVLSPELPQPVALNVADVNALVANFEAYAAQMSGVSLEEFRAAQTMGLTEADFEKLFAAVDQEQVTAILEGLASWNRNWLARGTSTGEPAQSMLGAEAADAIVYPMTQADLRAFVEVLAPLFTGADAYWREVYAFCEAMLGEEGMSAQGITAEQFVEMVRALPDQLQALVTLPEGTVIYAADYLTAEGEVSAHAIHAVGPTDENGEATTAYLEWAAAGDALYVSYQEMGTALVMTVSGEADANGGGTLSAQTEVFSGEESQARITLDCRKTVAENVKEFLARAVVYEGEEAFQWGEIGFASENAVESGKETRKGEFSYSVGDVTGQEIAFRVPYTVSKTVLDTTETVAATVDFGFSVGAEAFPVLTANYFGEIGEPTAAPFDPADPEIAFVHPAQMTPEAFTAWMNDQVIVRATQSVFHLLSVLPEEFLTLVMPEVRILPTDMVPTQAVPMG